MYNVLLVQYIVVYKKLGDNLYIIFNLLDKEAAAFCINTMPSPVTSKDLTASRAVGSSSTAWNHQRCVIKHAFVFLT